MENYIDINKYKEIFENIKQEVLKSQYNLDNTNDKIKFLQQIAKLLVDIDSQIELEIQVDNISRDYKISKEAIYAEINKIKYVTRKKENENVEICLSYIGSYAKIKT